MTSKLSTELELLIKNLESLNAPVLKLLNPPASESQVVNFFNQYFPGIAISPDIKDIFLWHNGTTIEHQVPVRKSYLFADFLLNSIEEMTSIMESQESFFKIRKYGFLPLFETGQGEYLALNLKDYSNNPDTTPLYYLSTWNPDFEIYTLMYENFYQMLVTINECFKFGVYFIDDKGLIDINSEKYNKISKKMNPNSEYWKRS